MILIPKVGIHLGVCEFIFSHSFTLSKMNVWTHFLTFSCTFKNVNVNVIFELHFQPTPFHTLVLVTSPRLKLWHSKLNETGYHFVKKIISKMGLNFIRFVKLVNKLLNNRYILVATNYATMWMEAPTFFTNIVAITTKFLYEHIFTKFGCPLIIVTNRLMVITWAFKVWCSLIGV
jgi:hypothetical protein